MVALPLGATDLNLNANLANIDADTGTSRDAGVSVNSTDSSRNSGGGGGSITSGSSSLASEQYAYSRKYHSEPELAAQVAAPPSTSAVKKYGYLLVAATINAAIVLSAKGLYLYVVLTGSSSYVLTIVAEMVLALFDLVWNWTVVTGYLNYLATVVAFTPNALILVKVLAFMFNSVAAPCVVAAFSDPDCIRGVFVPPESISTSYTYDYCATLDIAYTGSCPVIEEATVYTTYIPPFVYNFQCGSAMLTDYIPVFMFVYIFITFVMPSMYLVVLYLGPQRLPPALVRIMPGLFWPGIADKVKILYKRSNGECIYDLSPRLCNSVSKPDSVVSSLMHHFVVLTTFGVASPPLALCIAVSMITIVFFWQTLLGRYIQVCIELNHLDELAILEQEVAGAWKGSRSSARMLIVGASLFYGFFFYDITCAELGWQYAIIFPLVVIGVPIFAFTLMKSKRLRDNYVGTYHLPFLGDFVIAEGASARDGDGFGSDSDMNEPAEVTGGVVDDNGNTGLQRTNTVTVGNPFTRTSTWNPARNSSTDQSFANLFTRNTRTTSAAVGYPGNGSALPTVMTAARNSSIEKHYGEEM